jgi:hypothetical protein
MPFLVAKVDEVSPFLWIFRPDSILTTVVSRARRTVPVARFGVSFAMSVGTTTSALKPEP